MATTTNYGWTTPDNTAYVKDGALAIRTLGSSVDTSMAGKPKSSATYTANGTLTTSYASYISINLTTSTRPVFVGFSANYTNANSGSNKTVSIRAQLGGVTIGNEIVNLFSPWVSGTGTTYNSAHNFIVTPTAGAQTFTLQVLASAAGSVTLPAAQLVIFEI
jgi:hypothetical protein